METNYIELLNYSDTQIDITEYHTDYSILNDRSDKSSSGVWKHFGTLKHQNSIDRKHVYCIQCFLSRKIKKYQRSTSTGNLSKHLKKYHRISLNQTFRIKKEPENNTIVSIQKEQSSNEIGDDNANCVSGDGEEFLIHDINEILIAEVAKRPLLYNSTVCQGEKGLKHQTRRQLWTEIYEALNELIPYARLPKIWKNIRDRYHKVRRSLENAPTNYRPRYRYYDMLRFLDDAKSGDLLSSPQIEHVEEFENYVDEFLSTNENSKYISTETIELPIVKTESCMESFEPKIKKVKLAKTEVHQVDTPNTKRKILYTLANEIIEESPENLTDAHIEIANVPEAGTQITISQHIEHQQLQSLDDLRTNNADAVAICGTSKSALKLPSPTKKPDEHDMFGNFIAEVMRNMNKSQARKLQMNIMGLISDAEEAN